MRGHRASRLITTVGKFARPFGLARAGRPRGRQASPMAGHRLRPAFWRIAATREQRQRDPYEKFGLRRPMNASVAIIGGGIQGLMLAFCLAERGLRDVVVLDAGYWQGGASGRNGTLVRPGFSSPEWTHFFGHSHRLWLGLSQRL